ncbi:MAG: DUF58 domain-containing protein [Steroidobacteraceae bacterium]
MRRPPRPAAPGLPGLRAAPASPALPALPDLDELLALRGAAHGLVLSARAPARARLRGAHASAQRGRGLEFQEVRPYVSGDDPRTIDWRVTARRGRPHTKLFCEERERPVWLLVDLSPALFFGSRLQLKSALCLRAAALLAWTAALGGDRVGAVLAAGERGTPVLPPRARQAGVLPLLDALLALQPRAPAADTMPCLLQGLRTLRPLVRPGSLILVLSDFARLDQEVETLLPALASGGECRLFWITDALEERALPNGRFRAGLPGRLHILDGESVRSSWHSTWRAREGRLLGLSQQIGAPLMRLDTGEPAEQALRRRLQGRQSAA